MKLSTAIWAGCAAALAASAKNASPYGAIYALGANPSTSAPTLSPSDARLYLAQRLGLSEFHDLAGASDETIELLNSDEENQRPLFGARKGATRKTLVLVDDTMKRVDDLCVSRKSCTKVAELSETPSFQSNVEFVDELLSLEKQRRKPTKQCRLGKSGILAWSKQLAGGSIGPDVYGPCPAGLSFPGSASNGGSKDDTKQAVLSALGSNNEKSTSDIVDVYYIHGEGTGELDDDTKELLAGIANGGDDRSLTLVIMPPQKIHKSKPVDRAWSRKQISKRQEEGSSSKSMPTSLKKTSFGMQANVSRPTRPLPKYYDTEKACVSTTNNCTGHGSCKSMLKKSSEEQRWFCSCKADKKNNITTYWAGPACQKEDISVQFWMFALFSVAAVSVVTMGIGMLYNMGEQDLPSVLSAGIAPSKK